MEAHAIGRISDHHQCLVQRLTGIITRRFVRQSSVTSPASAELRSGDSWSWPITCSNDYASRNMANLGKIAELRPQERRAHVRYPFTAAADVLDTISGTRLSARCSDLGFGGCFIDTTSPFPVGTAVIVRLTMEQKSFQANASVTYSMPGMGMGLAFTAAEPNQVWVLKQWIGELSGEKPRDLAPVQPPKKEEPQEENSQPGAGSESVFVLNELIISLMRKKILTESEGKLLLKKLLT